MKQVRAVGMRRDLAARGIAKADPLGAVVGHAEALIFLGQKADHLSTRTPEWLAGGVGGLLSIAAVDAHHPQAADVLGTLAGVDREGHVRPIGRNYWIVLVDLRRR